MCAAVAAQPFILIHGLPEDWVEYRAVMPRLAQRFTVVAVGHDLGGLVTYAYVRRFPDSLRGAMILDVPVPGLAGWDEATAG